jgi:hypothetical protein
MATTSKRKPIPFSVDWPSATQAKFQDKLNRELSSQPKQVVDVTHDILFHPNRLFREFHRVHCMFTNRLARNFSVKQIIIIQAAWMDALGWDPKMLLWRAMNYHVEEQGKKLKAKQ